MCISQRALGSRRSAEERPNNIREEILAEARLIPEEIADADTAVGIRTEIHVTRVGDRAVQRLRAGARDVFLDRLRAIRDRGFLVEPLRAPVGQPRPSRVRRHRAQDPSRL